MKIIETACHLMFNCVIWTTDIGAAFGDVRPLDRAHMRMLSVNSIHLLDPLDSNTDFVSDLAIPAVGCITWPQRDHLVNIPQPRDRNDKLLEFLTRRSVASFNRFTTILSRYQHHLVPLLVTDGGETHSSCNFNCFIETGVPDKVTGSLLHVNVVISGKWCMIETLLLQTTNRKWYMAHEIAVQNLTLSDLEGHLPIASLCKWDFSYNWQDFNCYSAGLSPSAIAELLVF